MKLKLIIVCLLGTIISSFAQTGLITGKVTDQNAGFAIPYATVSVKDGDKIITGSVTDDNGIFEIKNLEFKSYTVEVQYMGYKSFSIPVKLTAESPAFDLKTITLQDDAVQLDDVTVVAELSTIEQKIDRKVINVGRDLTTSGATASEIMNNIPSVNVDQDGKLSLRGNENVRVLVDGRPTNIDPAQLLKQIPSTSIKKIELITNPSAKYNPEGMSGIINIILHKNSNDGFNASINSGLTIARTPKLNNSVNMNYRVGKVNFFATYGNNFAQHYNEGDVRRLDEFESQQLMDILNDSRSHLFKVGMDYYINDKNTISVYTNQNFLDGDWTVDTKINYPDPAQNQFQRASYLSDNTNSTYNLAYKRLTSKEGETLDFEINYNQYVEDQISSFDNQYSDPAFNDSYSDVIRDQRDNTTINLDYVNPLNEKSTLELGAEARIIRTDNVYTTDNDELGNANFNYNLDIYSAYATFGQKFEKISYQLGARFESYKVIATLDGETAYEDDYLTLYPSASMTYTLSEKNMFQLSYSRRVDRPSLEQTAPIREFSTPLLTSRGNPELDPQFTNSVELNYTRTLEKGSLSGGVFVRNINNEINRVITPDPQNPERQVMSWQNFSDNTAYGFELSANYKLTDWWDIQPAGDFTNIAQRGLLAVRNPVTDLYDMTERRVNVSAFNARINNNFKATKSLRFLLFGFYRSDVQYVQFRNSEMYKVDVGGRYSFWKDKATVSIRFNDVFKTMRSEFTGEHPFPTRGEFRWESRSVYIGLNYMFGTGKNKALQRKQRDDNTQQGGGLF